MWSKLDQFLNNITMYRLLLYGLASLAGIALLFSFFSLLPFSPWQILSSLLVFLLVARLANPLFSRLFGVAVNVESSYITAAILFFILPPAERGWEYWILGLVTLTALASKYILTLKNRHVFNPAAIGAVIAGTCLMYPATWWIGNAIFLPFVLILGGVVVKKIRRLPLLGSFLAVAVLRIFLSNLSLLTAPAAWVELLSEIVQSWPLIFFATIMVTEPLTAPAQRSMQMVFGAIVGWLFGSTFHWGPIYASPELALVLGNVFAYFFALREKVRLSLLSKEQLSDDIWEFVFEPSVPINFQAGQYLECTLATSRNDERGNRRYFTIASAPTEKVVRLTMKFAHPGSTFKQAMLALPTGGQLLVSQIAGDFVLTVSVTQPLVFIAGGIGITPFRSIVKYLIDISTKKPKNPRNITLFYAVRQPAELMYQNLWREAEQKLGMQVIFALTQKTAPDKKWLGKMGYLTPAMIKESIAQPQQARYYLSGPNAMVQSYLRMLLDMGVPRNQIVTDYFPGF